MHNLRCQPPSPDLREFVRTYAQREMFDFPAPISTSIPARLEQTLEFQFAERFDVVTASGRREFARPVTLVGSHTESATAVFTNNVISFGIFFEPVDFHAYFTYRPRNSQTGHSMHATSCLAGFESCTISSLPADRSPLE